MSSGRNGIFHKSDAECLFCGDFYSISIEGWIACRKCYRWAHNSCADLDFQEDQDMIIYYVSPAREDNSIFCMKVVIHLLKQNFSQVFIQRIFLLFCFLQKMILSCLAPCGMAEREKWRFSLEHMKNERKIFFHQCVNYIT